MDVLVVTLQIIAGIAGLVGAAVLAVGMWRESRTLGTATAAVSLLVLAGLLVAGGGIEGANALVLGLDG